MKTVLTGTNTDFPKEILRKGLHLGAMIIPLAILRVEKHSGLIVLGAAMVAALALDIARARFKSVAAMVHRLFGKLMRPDEISPSKNIMIVNGATWTLVSAFLLLLVFPAQIAAFALVVFLLGDAASGLAGRRFGRTSWRISNRTVEGSAAFLAVSLPAAWLMPGIEPWTGAFAVLFAAAAEILPGPFDDNLQVPVAAASAATLVQWITSGNFLPHPLS